MLNLFDTHVLLGKVKGSGAPVWYAIIEFTKHALFLGATGYRQDQLTLLDNFATSGESWVLDV